MFAPAIHGFDLGADFLSAQNAARNEQIAHRAPAQLQGREYGNAGIIIFLIGVIIMIMVVVMIMVMMVVMMV